MDKKRRCVKCRALLGADEQECNWCCSDRNISGQRDAYKKYDLIDQRYEIGAINDPDAIDVIPNHLDVKTRL